MDWEAIAAIAEAAAALAVIASLLYLAAQVKSGAKAFRTSQRDAALRTLMEWNYHIAADPDLASIFQRGCKDFDSLDERERARAVHVFYSFFKGLENQYLHYLNGVLEEEVWTRSLPVLAGYANQPGATHYFKMRKDVFDPRFRELVERMHDGPPARFLAGLTQEPEALREPRDKE